MAQARRMEIPEAGYPGLRYVLLHSFAHALMHQFTLECGYTAASIRERIYSLPPEHEQGPMAGMLLYTAAPDSEGTLGGLVGWAYPINWGGISMERWSGCVVARPTRSVPSILARKNIPCTKPPVTPVSFYRKHPANAEINIWTDQCSSQQ